MGYNVFVWNDTLLCLLILLVSLKCYGTTLNLLKKFNYSETKTGFSNLFKILFLHSVSPKWIRVKNFEILK
jgi:hypothetical protein